MHPEDLRKSYDKLAPRWSGDKFNFGPGVARHERALVFSETSGNALDIGCGSSGRILDLLVSKGFNAEGLDISDRMVEFAKQRHPTLTFYRADIVEWEFPRKYDFISAWDSLWHLPLSAQRPTLLKILDALNPKGVFIFSMAGTEASVEKYDDAMGEMVYYSSLGIGETLRILAQGSALCVHLEYDQHPEVHLCVIARKLS